eukprot:6105172-Ditylum_brightwellii.AAC.1
MRKVCQNYEDHHYRRVETQSSSSDWQGAKNRADQKPLCDGAIITQHTVWMFVESKHFALKVPIAVKIQSVFQGTLCYMEAERHAVSAIVLQRTWHKHSHHTMNISIKESVMKVQALFCAYACMKQYHATREGVICTKPNKK